MADDQFLNREKPGHLRRGRIRSAFCLLCAVAVVAGWGRDPALAPGGGSGPPAFQKGMVLGIFSRTDREYFRRSIKELGDLGVNSVSLIVPKVQRDVRSIGFYDDPMVTPSDESLRLAAREAHREGMRVFLFPIVYVEQIQNGEWRGTLSPPDWDRWFLAYEQMILHYARLGAEEKVEFFSVGSELCSTEKFRKRWERVIAKVRRVFPGGITYSANWDHLDPVTFAGDLDFLGMNAYYEVGKGGPSDVKSMVARWREIQKGIRGWWSDNGRKPLVITEIGYPSRTDSGTDPWNYFGEGDPDPQGQRKCYEAFVQAWKGEKMLEGVYFYLWWGKGGVRDKDYTPRGKGADSVIRDWFRGMN